MLMQKYRLFEAKKKLARLAKAYQRQVETQSEKFAFDIMNENVKMALRDYRLAASEECAITDHEKDFDVSRLSNSLKGISMQVNEAVSTNDFWFALKPFLDIFGTPDDIVCNESASSINVAAEFRNFGRYGAKNCATTLRHIFRHFAYPSNGRSIKCLIPNAMDKSGISSWKSSGLFNDPDRIKFYVCDEFYAFSKWSARNFERLVRGGFLDNGMTATNDAFDLSILLPSITIERKSHGISYENFEQDYIQKATNYIRPGGWLICGLPVSRYTRSVCIFLSRSYHDAFLVGDSSSVLPPQQTIFFVGKKNVKKEKEADPSVFIMLWNIMEEFERLKSVYNSDDMVDLPRISFPEGETVLKVFRGSVITDTDIQDMYASSLVTNEFRKSLKGSRAMIHSSRPPLPLNAGQIGLALASGCLDGIIDEKNGHSHAIKGRVVRRTKSEEPDIDEGAGSVSFVDINASRVEISAFLPDGEYKVLA